MCTLAYCVAAQIRLRAHSLADFMDERGGCSIHTWRRRDDENDAAGECEYNIQRCRRYSLLLDFSVSSWCSLHLPSSARTTGLSRSLSSPLQLARGPTRFLFLLRISARFLKRPFSFLFLLCSPVFPSSFCLLSPFFVLLSFILVSFLTRISGLLLVSVSLVPRISFVPLALRFSCRLRSDFGWR